MRVGFIGLGSMGGRMCRNIIRNSGQQVLVFDVNVAAVSDCTALGAEAAQSVADLAGRTDVIFTSLPTPTIVEEVGLGPGGIGDHARRGTVWFDLTTNSPDVARGIASALERTGVTMADAPVSGGITRAESGTITLMVGGDPSLVETHGSLLRSFTSKVVHMGPIGSGAVAKLVNNMIMFSYVAGAAEGLILGTEAGLDPAVLLECLQSGTADSAALRAVGSRALSGDWKPSMTLDLGEKDVRLAVELASTLGSPTPVAHEAHRLLKTAQEMGLGQDDATALLRVHEDAVGRTITEAAASHRS